MSLDPHINREVVVQNQTLELKMVVTSREPEPAVERWVWIGAFDLLCPAALCGDGPLNIRLGLCCERKLGVAAVIRPNPVAVDQLLDEVEIRDFRLVAKTVVMAIERRLTSWTEVIAVPVLRRMLEVPKLTSIAGVAGADQAVLRTR
jgi:hypothetical protein